MNRLTTVFGVTTLVAAILAGIFWKQLRAERLLTAQLQERVTQLEQQPAAARPVIANALPGTVMAVVPSPVAPVPTTAAVPSPGNAVIAPTALNSIALDLSRDPEFCAAQKASLRGQLPQMYPDAGKVLGLSPTQSTALTELLIKQQERSLDAACGPEESRRRAQTSPQAQQAEIEALLGPAKYQEWQEYLPTREGRTRVIQLRNAVAGGDTPLTDQQAQPLLETVLAEGKRRREENAARPMPTDPRARLDYEEETIRLLEASQNRLLSSAQTYLSASQIAVMQNSMTQQVTLQRALLRARRAQLESGNAGAANGVVILPAAPR